MNIQNLLIYQFNTLYEILKELDDKINFEVINVNDEKFLKNLISSSNKYLIITKKQKINFNNQVALEKFPIKLNKFIEKLNIQFLRQQFNDQSKFKVNDYIIDLNSRYIFFENKKLIGTFKTEFKSFAEDNVSYDTDVDKNIDETINVFCFGILPIKVSTPEGDKIVISSPILRSSKKLSSFPIETEFLSSHGVIATIDMHNFTCCFGEPVRHHGQSCSGYRNLVIDVPSHGGSSFPGFFEI